MTLLEKIKADREAGTPGPWQYSDVTFTSVWGQNDELVHYTTNSKYAATNARRIARVPDMETALLAAGELADAAAEFANYARSRNQGAIDPMLEDACYLLQLVNAFRKAIEVK